jgi:hypothetical protein
MTMPAPTPPLVVLQPTNRLGRKEPNNDDHYCRSSFQSRVSTNGLGDTQTGEFQEQRLLHREAAESSYRELATWFGRVRIGMEARSRARSPQKLYMSPAQWRILAR